MKIHIEDEFNLKSVPINKTIKGFESIPKCYEVAGRKDKSSSIQ
jgi:hypothetical protein